MAKTGRPSTYTQAKCARICRRLAGGMSLSEICRTDDDLPHLSTVYDWLQKYPKFAESYTRARKQQADYYADEIVRIADTEYDPQRARVMIDARKWVAGKMRPTVYGDSSTLKHTGTGQDGAVVLQVSTGIDRGPGEGE